jgi:endonuclease/exonuclease/phosphatase family metal-dependent hydrolase
MDRTIRGRGLAFLALTAALGLAACEAPTTTVAPDEFTDPSAAFAAARHGSADGESLRLFTRNMYMGADDSPIFEVDFSDFAAVAAAAQTFWSAVQATDVQERAMAIAAEVAMTDPHVIGLQEAAQHVVLGFNPQAPPTYFTPVAVQDFVMAMQAALGAAGLDYTLMGVQENTQALFPLALNPDIPGGIAQLLRVTLREATFVRSDLVSVASFMSGNYAATFDVGPVTLKRGWSKVKLELGGPPIHVINTHLEGQSLEPIQLLQTGELIQFTEGLDGTVIIMGDLNSDANGEEGETAWTPTYGMLTDAGFVDAWTRSTGPRGPGFTCCHEKDLVNAVVDFDERIDLVLFRTGHPDSNGKPLPGRVDMEVLGDELGNQTASGLWPADHGALFAAFRLPRGLYR